MSSDANIILTAIFSVTAVVLGLFLFFVMKPIFISTIKTQIQKQLDYQQKELLKKDENMALV